MQQRRATGVTPLGSPPLGGFTPRRALGELVGGRRCSRRNMAKRARETRAQRLSTAWCSLDMCRGWYAVMAVDRAGAGQHAAQHAAGLAVLPTPQHARKHSTSAPSTHHTTSMHHIWTVETCLVRSGGVGVWCAVCADPRRPPPVKLVRPRAATGVPQANASTSTSLQDVRSSRMSSG